MTWDTDKAEFMRKNHPNAQFEYFEKSGHKIFADEPVKFFALLKTFIESALRTSYACKPGNRLVFSEPPSPLMRKFAVVRSMPQSEANKKALLECYELAIQESPFDKSIWGPMAFHLIKNKCYEQALSSLINADEYMKQSSPDNWAMYNYFFKAWQGHMLDILGKRDEAIARYQIALQTLTSTPCDDFFGIKINKQWIEEHLTKPFQI
ncbi:MAG: hypothetical protein US49_C0005G0044 [candidate division TM6 bacterium GW2011_GWF2_37_49]|nr:MAG: hypothetical protein US49_C0005G0044 [candidate division TM6 bacterium GW2011_GWF2_37_49]